MKQLLNILEEIRPDVNFSVETGLIDHGILDSFDIIALVGELNDAFHIEISVEHLLPENFNSLEAIMNLIHQLQAKD